MYLMNLMNKKCMTRADLSMMSGVPDSTLRDIHDGAIDCDYFLDCVLPAEWNLNDLVSYALWYDEEDEDPFPHGMKRCEICQNPFVPTHAKQKYCKGCAETANRKKTRTRMYEQRHNT